MNVDTNAHHPWAKEEFVCTIYYRCLEYIIKCTIPPNTVSRNIKPTVVLLAIITTCNTQGCNATLEQMHFKALTSYVEVVDLAAICAIIGHIQISTANPCWAIINHSGNWACMVFMDDSLSPEASQGANI